VSETPSTTNITALFSQAATKSGLLWVEELSAQEGTSTGRTWPVWHVWLDDTVYVVSGPGEQELPWLPGDVRLILRSKDTGGRLLSVHASVEELTPDSPRWEPVVAALKKARLNARDDVEERWRSSCTVRALHPFGTPSEAPGSYAAESRAAPVLPSTATTVTRRPWHLRGRPRRRWRQRRTR
jgi:hypothetical protein